MRYVLILAILSLLSFTACQQATSQSGNNAANNANKPRAAAPEKTPDNVKRISIADAKAAVDAGKAVIVDVRSADAWKNDRIKDSLSAPLGELDAKLAELPKDKELIFYCSCPSEHTSAEAVIKSKDKGVTNTSALLGGTDAWRNAGNPMDGEAKNKAANSSSNSANGNAPVKKP